MWCGQTSWLSLCKDKNLWTCVHSSWTVHRTTTITLSFELTKWLGDQWTKESRLLLHRGSVLEDWLANLTQEKMRNRRQSPTCVSRIAPCKKMIYSANGSGNIIFLHWEVQFRSHVSCWLLDWSHCQHFGPLRQRDTCWHVGKIPLVWFQSHVSC